VRLVRIGNTISAYVSPTGDGWTLVGSDSFSMGGTIYVGLPITSHADGTVASAALTNVVVSGDTAGTPPPPPPPSPVALPAPWTTADIGAVSPAGSATHDGGLWTVTGSGADIWGTADAFRFVSQPLDGDGEIVARVASIQNVEAWTKAGVMMRETTAAGSAHATMFASWQKGTAFQRRPATGNASVSTAGVNTAAPYWVKMTRVGNVFTAFTSPDGLVWTQVGTETIPMAGTIEVGLAVTSHRSGSLATATFDNVAATRY
jgi:hypothetical protein